MSVCWVYCPIKDVGWCYLGTDVFKGGWADERKADQEHILKKTKDIKHVAAVTLTFPIGTQVRYDDMDFSFPPCESLAQRPVCCKDKGAETRALSLPPAGLQTVYRYYGYKALLSALHLTNERRRESSLHGDAVTLKLTGLQLHL